MNTTMQQTWASLQAASLVKGLPPEQSDLESPWYLKVLLAFSGWVASLFLLGFVAAAFSSLLDNTTMCFIVGGAMLAIAYTLLKLRKNAFVEHMALAISFAGQALLVWSFFKMSQHNEITLWLLTALLQAGLAMVMPNFIHRVCSALAAGIALHLLLAELRIAYLTSSLIMFSAAYLWLHEFSYPRYAKAIRALGYGLVLALITIKTKLFVNGSFLFGYRGNSNSDTWIQPWMGELLTCAVLLYVVWQLLQNYGLSLNNRIGKAAILGAIILGLLSLEAQGIAAGMMILLLGFAASNIILQGLGILSLLYYISSYYYLLNITLLEKAQILLVLGLTMLFVRWIVQRYLSNTTELDHA